MYTQLFRFSDEQVIAALQDMGYKDTSNGVWEELAINEGFEYNEELNKWSWDEDPDQYS